MAGADLEIAELESSSPRPSGPVRVPFRRPLLVAALFSLVYLLAYSSLSVVLDHNRPLLAKVANPLELIPPLFAAVFLESNARGKNSRERWFWYLLALGTGQWFVGQLLWVYFEVFLGQPVPHIFFGDIVFFLRIVPFLAAAGLRPDRQRLPHGYRPTYLDFIFLVLWWIFLYSFMVLPWQFIQPDLDPFHGDWQIHPTPFRVMPSGAFPCPDRGSHHATSAKGVCSTLKINSWMTRRLNRKVINADA